MKYYDWNDEKNELLKKLRGVSFEQVVLAIVSGDLIDRIRHPNPEKYPNQKVFLVKIGDYVYSVPYVEDEPVGEGAADPVALEEYLAVSDYDGVAFHVLSRPSAEPWRSAALPSSR